MFASKDPRAPAAAVRRSARRAFRPLKEIRAKATLFVLLLLASTVCVSYLLTIRILNDHVRGEIVKRAESLSRSIASSAGYNLVPKDLLALDNLVFKIKESNPDITSIAILGPDRTVVVHSEAGRAGSRLAPAAGRVVAAGAGGTDIRERIDPGDTSFAVES